MPREGARFLLDLALSPKNPIFALCSRHTFQGDMGMGMRLQEHAAADELLTPSEVAAILFVDPKTVTRWARAGKLDAIRTPGGHRRYLRSDVLAIMTGHHQSQQPDLSSVQPSTTRTPYSPISDPATADMVAEATAAALEAEAEAAAADVIVTAAAVTAAAEKAADAAIRARAARAFAAAQAAQSAARHATRTAAVVAVPSQRDPVGRDVPRD
jgi:excisionase family DNA binding protein